jgi:hypothetical protein
MTHRSVDHDELLRRVREEVLRARPAGEMTSRPLPPVEPLLEVARDDAAVWAKVPAMRRFPAPVRPLLRAVGWVVSLGGRLLFRPQRRYNQALVEIADLLARRVSELEEQVRTMQADLIEAQLTCREMTTLQSRFDFLDVWTRDTLAHAAGVGEGEER